MNLKITLPFVALLTLSACTNPVGVWLFTFGETEVANIDEDCSENLRDASCPADGWTDDNGWTHSESHERSDAAAFAEIIDGPDGESYLVMDGEVYVGHREGGPTSTTLIFEWEHYDRSEEVSSHESGYSMEESVDSTVWTRLVMNRDGRTMTGTLTTDVVSEQTWVETDRWSQSGSGISYGNIGDDVYLEGSTTNYVDQSECDSDPCRIDLESQWDTLTPVVGTLTSADDDAFDGISGAGRSEGVPSSF